MPDNTPTLTADQRALVTVARRGFHVSGKVTLDAADALVGLADSGLGVRPIARLLDGTAFAPSPATVSRYITVRRTLPAETTGEDFRAALAAFRADQKAEAAAKRAAKDADADVSALTDAAGAIHAAVPGDLDALTDALADLFETARQSLNAADLTRFLNSAFEEVAFSTPVAVAA